MIEDILKLNGLSIEILSQLSYESQLGISLKKNLHYFDKKLLMQELKKVTEWYDEQEILDEVALDYRIKSIESISSKYDRYFPNKQTRKTFNDILGFRAFCDSYSELLYLKEEKFRVANMSDGKSSDDGYRGVHVYFQKNSRSYPIEIQFNTLYDRQLNNWLHDYLYKKSYPIKIGKYLRNLYENGEINDKDQFEEALNNVLLNRKK